MNSHGTRIRITAAWLVLFVFLFAARAQTRVAEKSTYEIQQKRLELFSEIQVLATRAKQLDKPLARALAEAEIADAAWWIDREMAKELLREAFLATFPDEAEQLTLRQRPVGAALKMPTPHDTAGASVRSRVMKVVVRDKSLAEELTHIAREKLGAYDAHRAYSSLAQTAISEKEYEAAGKYLRSAIDAEPTQLTTAFDINLLATGDRATADELILAYISRLSTMTLPPASRARAMVALSLTIRPQSAFWGGNSATPLPGPSVMRAYVAFVMSTIAALERQSPESIFGSRSFLLSTYPLLSQYAPDLRPQFLELEQRSRRPGESFSLPTNESLQQDSNSKYQKQVSREMDSDHPDELVIQFAISRGDFAKARKMIDKLEEGPKKVQLLDLLNVKQALAMVSKGEIAEARKLAESLVKATSVLQVFPAIINKCLANKDEVCAGELTYQAMKQLKNADTSPAIPPPGVPASFAPTSRTYDPVVAGLSKLATSVFTVNDLVFQVAEELAKAANRSELDAGEGYIGFDSALFTKLAEKDEVRAVSTAMSFDNPLQQIVALAAIGQWRSAKFKPNAIPRAMTEPAQKEIQR
jgi:hypothetical protein